MGSPVWSRPRAIVLVAAAAFSVIAGVLVGTVVARDTPADDVVTLDQPGEYVEPGTATNPPLAADALPPVALRDADGARFEPSDDRPMVVNIWFSTCPPCARELVEFGELDRELGDEVRFVGVNPTDDADEMLAFAAARDVGYELYLDDDGAFTDALGIVTFPVTLLVSPDGTVIEQTGALTGGELRTLLADRWGIE